MEQLVNSGLSWYKNLQIVFFVPFDLNKYKMFSLDSSNSASEEDVWVGAYTLEEAIHDVTKRRRAPIDHRHSCISSFSLSNTRDKPSDKSTSETSYATACDTVDNTEHHKETGDESIIEGCLDSNQPAGDGLLEENLDALTLKSKSSQNYNDQSSDNTRLESSYSTAFSEVHNRSNRRIFEELATVEACKEQAAEDSNSNQSSIDDLEENLSALSLESKSSEDFSFQHYYDAEKHAEKNAQESSYTSTCSEVHNKNSQRISKKLSVTETSKENIAEDLDAEQCFVRKLQGQKLDSITFECETSKYEFHKKWSSNTEEAPVESIAKEVSSLQSSVSEFREESLTAITLDSDSSKDYTSSSAYSKSTHENSDLNRILASSFNPEDQIKSKYNSDSSGPEESVENLHLKPNGGSNKALPTPDERLSDSFTLDDTMEELNQFIQQGPDYVMSPKSKASKNLLGVPDDFIPLARSTNANVFPESFTSRSTTKTSTASTGFKSRLPTFSGRKPTGQSAQKTNTAKSVENRDLKKTQPKESPVKSAEKEEFQFKVPKPPLNRTPRSNLKYIVSPVGIYIKYTPRYVPLVKVPATSPPKTSRTKLFVAAPQSKENIPEALNCEIPAVIYKPASKRIVSEQQVVKLPNSIKKLVSPQVVTKHERRIERQQHDVSIERRLLESDLTINVNDDNQDISILVNKQPFDIVNK